MKSILQSINNKFTDLSTREKWLISIGVLVAIVLIFSMFIIEPVYKSVNNKTKQLQSIISANRIKEGQLQALISALKKDPNEEINKQLEALKSQSGKLSEQLSQIVDSLVSPSDMADLLQQVLDEGSGIKLISLESLGAEPIASNAQTSQYSGYYIHPVRIQLSGSYFAIYSYLDKLEKLSAKYYWRSFDYSVDKYPKANLTLEVYTLGSRQEFIGG